MKVLKVLNNNVVSSLDEKGRETMVLGSGIGFQKKAGDEIDENRIEKIFRLPNDVSDDSKTHFHKLVEEIPYEYVKYADEIIRGASEKLGKKLNRNIYITLTDHIHFAIERYRQNIVIPNAMLLEIRRFYNPEYLMGLRAVELINKQENIHLTEDEAAFIALHIINAELDLTMQNTTNMPRMISDILNIVRISMRLDYDENSIVYERFVVHLKYMIRRTYENAFYPEASDDIYEMSKRKHPESYEVAKKIRKYMLEKTGKELPDEEMCYLMIHLTRLQKSRNSQKTK